RWVLVVLGRLSLIGGGGSAQGPFSDRTKNKFSLIDAAVVSVLRRGKIARGCECKRIRHGMELLNRVDRRISYGRVVGAQGFQAKHLGHRPVVVALQIKISHDANETDGRAIHIHVSASDVHPGSEHIGRGELASARGMAGDPNDLDGRFVVDARKGKSDEVKTVRVSVIEETRRKNFYSVRNLRG